MFCNRALFTPGNIFLFYERMRSSLSNDAQNASIFGRFFFFAFARDDMISIVIMTFHCWLPIAHVRRSASKPENENSTLKFGDSRQGPDLQRSCSFCCVTYLVVEFFRHWLAIHDPSVQIVVVLIEQLLELAEL